MKASYKILLTSAKNPRNCDAEFIRVNTSLSPANEAMFAQALCDTVSGLYAKQGREMLGMWELDIDGNEQKFYQ